MTLKKISFKVEQLRNFIDFKVSSVNTKIKKNRGMNKLFNICLLICFFNLRINTIQIQFEVFLDPAI